MDDHLPLVRDVLDKQVLDPDKCKIGKVDGILLQLRANRPPRVTAMEISQSAAWRRLHPRLGDLADWLRAKCEPGQDRPPRRVELLLGKKVHAPDGTLVGRIEEFRAERENSYWVVTEFHLGRPLSSNALRCGTSVSRCRDACTATGCDGIKSISRTRIILA